MAGFFSDNPPPTQVGSEDAAESTIQEDAVTQGDTSSGFFQGSPDQTTTDAYTADALAAKIAAEAAKSAAELAETNAETAKSAAELAETNAETAETNAETAETNAETAETNAAGSATSATNSASTATTKASEAAASASTASTASTSATNSSNTATTKAAEASTSASNAASSETAAGNSAATSATQAQNSSASAASSLASKTASEAAKVSAETAETNAETAETNAAGSATAAAGSATSATNSSSTASSQASASATQASSSASSATASSNSATSAATAQNAAEAARDSALAALDSFDDRYLGSKSSAPTVDNDGNALVSGALYFDSTATAMKVWDGSNWLNAYASLSGALIANNNLSDLNNAATARSNLGLSVADGLLSQNNFTNADHTKLDGIAASANNYALPSNISAASLDISGNIDVDGITNLDVVDIDGAVDMASTLAVAGEITANGGISLVDNKKLTFGTGDDLEVYHDGNNSYINDVGTGNIFIRGANVVLTTGAGTKYLEGGSNVLRLYHTGNQRMQTSAAGISVTGTVTATGTSVFASLDISGDIDVDGTTNLDIVDIDGAVDMASTLAVGGATTGAGYLYLSSKTANQGLRLNNTTKIQAWNPAGTVLRSLMQLDANEDVRIGSSANPIYLDNTTNVTGSIKVSGNIFRGTNPATAGDIRMAAASTIRNRNAANTGNITMVGTNASDEVTIASSGQGTVVGGALDVTKDLKLGFNATRPTAWDTNSYVWTKSGADSGLHLDGYNVYLSTGNSETLGLEVDVNQNVSIPNGNLDVTGGLRASGYQATPLTNEGLYGGHPTRGAYIQGHGSANDFTVANQSGTIALVVPQNTINVEARGDLAVTGAIRNSTAPANYAHNVAANMVIGNTGSNGGLTIASSATAAGSIHFAKGSAGTDEYRGYLNYIHSTDTMSLGVSAANRFTMTTTDAQFSTNNLTKLWGTVPDVTLTRSASTAGCIHIYRNNGNQPWSFTGGAAGVSTNMQLYYSGASRGYFNSTSGAYVATSLRKFKADIEDVVDPYEIIRRLRPRTYTMSGESTAGYIYDEVDGVLDAARMDAEINHEPLGVDHNVINTYTTAAVQRLIVASEVADAKIAQLEADIQELRGLLT